MRSLPDNNLSYPVLVQIGDGIGSGFYFRTDQKLFLVTALHILYRVKEQSKPLRGNIITLTSYDRDLSITAPIEFEVDLPLAPIRKNDSKDIVLVEIGDIQVENEIGNIRFGGSVRPLTPGGNFVVVPNSSLKRFDDVLVSNDVFILGYPSSLGFPEEQQIELKKPLLRKGIIAGKNTSNGTVILDCPIYFGNSGGMAIEVEEVSPTQKRFMVIGVVSQFIPFVERLKSIQLGYTNLSIENSGYSVVVPIDTILELTTESPSPQTQTP